MARTSAALTDYLDWPGLQQLRCLERTLTERGTTTVELAYAITSLPPEGLLALPGALG